MRPLKLELENIGPFVGRETLDFTAVDDLFLITGQTGSGKSTIFDALCYALYGSLPGSRRGQTRKLRSDFAAEDAACSVALDFSLGEKRYRIERTPPRLRRKARGEGFTEDGEVAALYELKPDGRLPLSGKTMDADEKIKRLIGLSDDEFAKIVLLPQGEFAEFLRQNTNERREVLRKLFPVDLAVRVRETAQARARDAVAELREAERSLAECRGHFDPERYDEQRQALQTKANDIRAAQGLVQARTEALTEALRAALAAEETARRLEAARRREAELAAGASAIAAAETALAASRSAKPLAPLIRQAKETAEQAENAGAAAAAATEAATAAEASLRRAEADTAALADDEKRLIDQRRRLDDLEKAAQDWSRAAAEREELAGIDRRLSELDRRTTTLETTEKRLATERTMLEIGAAAFDSLDRAWQAAKTAMDEAKRLKPLAERSERLAEDDRQDGERRRKLDGIIAETELLLRERTEAVRAAEDKAAERLKAERAADLAAGLVKGQPCPVCGALDHPLPAGAPGFRRDSAADLAQMKRDRDEAAERLAASRAELTSLVTTISRRSRELDELVGEIGGPPPSARVAADSFENRLAALNAASVRRAEAGQAGTKLTLLQRERESAAAALRALVKERSELDARRAGLSTMTAIAAERTRAALAAAAVPDDGFSATDSVIDNIDQVLGTLRAQGAFLAGDLDRRRKARQAAAVAAAENAVLAAAAKNRVEAAAETAARSRRTLDAALADSMFATVGNATVGIATIGNADRIAAVERAILTEADEIAKETEIRLFREETAKARGLRSELERQTAVTPERRPLADLERESAEVKAERERLADDQAKAAAALHDLERERAAFEAAEARRGALAERGAALKTLADDLAGANPKKRSFDAWLLSLYLSEVAAFAARRLERMSEGRYRLILDSEREGGRGLAGLDLAVFDAYTGKARPCATLSGGESFMASICLALGLADSIQARAGGVRLDSLFIDEGFGSLDEAGLDKALSILDEIRDHRMVGLISHVAELRTRIGSRVDIIKTNIGSRIRQTDGA